MNKTWIGVVILAVVVGVLWQQGMLARIANYCRETSEELKKCNWPTWEELKGSTALVFVIVLLLGAFTFAANTMFSFVFQRLVA